MCYHCVEYPCQRGCRRVRCKVVLCGYSPCFSTDSPGGARRSTCTVRLLPIRRCRRISSDSTSGGAKTSVSLHLHVWVWRGCCACLSSSRWSGQPAACPHATYPGGTSKRQASKASKQCARISETGLGRDQAQRSAPGPRRSTSSVTNGEIREGNIFIFPNLTISLCAGCVLGLER